MVSLRSYSCRGWRTSFKDSSIKIVRNSFPQTIALQGIACLRQDTGRPRIKMIVEKHAIEILDRYSDVAPFVDSVNEAADSDKNRSRILSVTRL
jgi:hypothetical protein